MAVTYTVKSGDSLSKIAAIYGLTWQQIYEANKTVIGGNPDLIKPGQVLTIPGTTTNTGNVSGGTTTTTSPTTSGSGNTYTVVSGDSLSKIAARYGLTWQQIYEANKSSISDPNLIYPGQVLTIPTGSGSTSGTTTTGTTTTTTTTGGTTTQQTGVPWDMNKAAGTYSDTINEAFLREIVDRYGGVSAADFQRFLVEINSGTRTIANLEYWLDWRTRQPGFVPQSGTTVLGGTQIPKGAQLVAVKDPAGTDATELFYLVYTYQGIQFAFEVGNAARMVELFGNDYRSLFDTINTVTQPQFDSFGYINAGSADELYGSTESFASIMELNLRAAGLEDIPDWIRNDPVAMALVVEATQEGWSTGRLWVELSQLDSFSQRFPAMDRYLQSGLTVQEAVNEYVQDESALRSVIRRYLPVGAEIDNQYLADVMINGWTPGQAVQILEASNRLATHPDALTQANLILEASGLDPLDEAGLLNVLTGGAPPEVIEAFNTAAAGIALAQAGVEDVDIDLLMSVIDETTVLASIEDFQSVAQNVALNIIRNARDLDFARFDLSEDDIIAAAFGRESPSGKTLGETLNLLNRLERERQISAQGDPGAIAYIDERDRLRLQGFRSL